MQGFSSFQKPISAVVQIQGTVLRAFRRIRCQCLPAALILFPFFSQISGPLFDCNVESGISAWNGMEADGFALARLVYVNNRVLALKIKKTKQKKEKNKYQRA